MAHAAATATEKPSAWARAAAVPAASTEPATEDSTPMNSDGPTAAAIWMNVFRMATPCGFCSGDKVCNPAVWEGESTRLTPAYTTTEATSTPASDRVGRKGTPPAAPR